MGSELKEYTYTENGAERSFLLSDADAEARGLTGGKAPKRRIEATEVGSNPLTAEADAKAASAPANKRAASPSNKSA